MASGTVERKSFDILMGEIETRLKAAGPVDGVFLSLHGAMIIEDEPGIRADTKTFWDRAIPADPTWQHNQQNPGEDNGHSHLRGQLQGPSITIPFADRTLLLGTWQQIVVVDFDTRARSRDLIVQILGE